MSAKVLGVLLAFAVSASAAVLRFELPASYAYQNRQHCVSQYSNKDALVMGQYKISGIRSSGSSVSVTVTDRFDNRLHVNNNIVQNDQNTFVVTTPMHSDVDVCFVNNLNEGVSYSDLVNAQVELSIKTGYEAVDFNELGRLEDLKPAEVELRKMESIVQSMVTERQYLNEREKALRDTNESTYDRVKWFSVASMALLVVMGIYQVLHMRSFLKKKKAI